MENNMQIEKLIEKFHLGTITSEEMALLMNYLKEKEPGSEILEYYQKVWDKAEENISDFDSQVLYNQITGKIDLPTDRLFQVKKSLKEPLFKAYIWPLMRYAAVFILALGLSWLIFGHSWNKIVLSPVADQIQKMEVPLGSKSRIILPDSTIVTLNSGSTLSYSTSDFNSGSRKVFLTGEGFFNVMKDSVRPFYATTPGIKVKVTGTTFNIKAYPGENIEEATVVTGEVEIFARSDETEKGMPIVLKPNQTAVFAMPGDEIIVKDSMSASPVIKTVTLRTVNLQPSSKIEQTVSWKENRLIFDNEPFKNLVVRIERWYDVEIEVKYQELYSARFTGKFDKETLEQVLNALVTVTPFKYTVKQNIITITKD